jgi:MYXO-CTERM domain-containing protein
LGTRSLKGLCAALALTPSAALAQVDDDPEGRLPRGLVVDVQERVERAFETHDHVPVFILLREDTLAMDDRKHEVAAALGGELELWHSYRNIPAIAGDLSRAGLARLRQNAAVSAVQLDGTGSGGLAEAVPAVGVDKVQSMRGLSGKGVTVAILDSGASTKHPALQGAIVAEHCFTRFGCPPGAAAEGDSAEDDHNHGSNVAGIVASRGAGGVSKGYAPGSSIVAVKVLNGQNSGQTSDWVAGFDWVLTNQQKLGIKVINASLVSDSEYANAADCDRSETAMATVVKKLFDAGVTITASSGNTGHTATMTSPACNTGVIAVGATYDSNLGKQPESGGTYQALGGSRWPACSDAMTNTKTIACFTSTAGARLDVLAPGSQLKSCGKGTGVSTFRGTSQAAPGVAGLSALLLECNPALTPTQLLDTLKKSGEQVVDSRSGMMYPLIRGVEAADLACNNAAAPAGTAAGAAGGTAVVGAAAGGIGATAGALAANSGATPAAGGGAPVTTTTGSPVATNPGVPTRTSAAGSGTIPSSAPGVGAGTAGRPAGASGTTAPPTTVPTAGAATAEPPPNPSGCQCSAPGALPSHTTWTGTAGLGLLGLAFHVRLRRRK